MTAALDDQATVRLRLPRRLSGPTGFKRLIQAAPSPSKSRPPAIGTTTPYLHLKLSHPAPAAHRPSPAASPTSPSILRKRATSPR